MPNIPQKTPGWAAATYIASQLKTPHPHPPPPPPTPGGGTLVLASTFV